MHRSLFKWNMNISQNVLQCSIFIAVFFSYSKYKDKLSQYFWKKYKSKIEKEKYKTIHFFCILFNIWAHRTSFKNNYTTYRSSRKPTNLFKRKTYKTFKKKTQPIVIHCSSKITQPTNSPFGQFIMQTSEPGKKNEASESARFPQISQNFLDSHRRLPGHQWCSVPSRWATIGWLILAIPMLKDSCIIRSFSCRTETINFIIRILIWT